MAARASKHTNTTDHIPYVRCACINQPHPQMDPASIRRPSVYLLQSLAYPWRLFKTGVYLRRAFIRECTVPPADSVILHHTSTPALTAKNWCSKGLCTLKAMVQSMLVYLLVNCDDVKRLSGLRSRVAYQMP